MSSPISPNADTLCVPLTCQVIPPRPDTVASDEDLFRLLSDADRHVLFVAIQKWMSFEKHEGGRTASALRRNIEYGTTPVLSPGNDFGATSGAQKRRVAKSLETLVAAGFLQELGQLRYRPTATACILAGKSGLA